MSRWRPPAEKSTALITREGHDRLKAEVDALTQKIISGEIVVESTR